MIDPAKANYGPSPIAPAVQTFSTLREYERFILRQMCCRLDLPMHVLTDQDSTPMHDAAPTEIKSAAPPVVQGTDVIGTSGGGGTIIYAALLMVVFTLGVLFGLDVWPGPSVIAKESDRAVLDALEKDAIARRQRSSAFTSAPRVEGEAIPWKPKPPYPHLPQLTNPPQQISNTTVLDKAIVAAHHTRGGWEDETYIVQFAFARDYPRSEGLRHVVPHKIEVTREEFDANKVGDSLYLKFKPTAD